MPNTDSYLLLGLGIVAAIMLGYPASLYLRFRQSAKLISTLEQLKNEA